MSSDRATPAGETTPPRASSPRRRLIAGLLGILTALMLVWGALSVIPANGFDDGDDSSICDRALEIKLSGDPRYEVTGSSWREQQRGEPERITVDVGNSTAYIEC